MKQKLIIAFSTTVFMIVLAISIDAHCGSTWVTQAPTFGPTLGFNNCTVNSNPTTTSKSVSTVDPLRCLECWKAPHAGVGANRFVHARICNHHG